MDYDEEDVLADESVDIDDEILAGVEEDDDNFDSGFGQDQN